MAHVPQRFRERPPTARQRGGRALRMAAAPALPPGLASALHKAEPRSASADSRRVALKAASPWLAHCAALCQEGAAATDGNMAPEAAWFYRGDDSAVQGPYDAATMLAWYDAGHLKEELEIRRGVTGAFLPLREFLVGGPVTCFRARSDRSGILPSFLPLLPSLLYTTGAPKPRGGMCSRSTRKRLLTTQSTRAKRWRARTVSTSARARARALGRRRHSSKRPPRLVGRPRARALGKPSGTMARRATIIIIP